MVCELFFPSREFLSWAAYKKKTRAKHNNIIFYGVLLENEKQRKINKKSYNYTMMFNEKC